MKRTTSLACASLVIGASVALACGGSSQEQQPAQQPLYGAQAGYGQPAPAATDPNAPQATPYGQQPAPAATPAAPAPAATPAATSNPIADQAMAMAVKGLLTPRVGTEAKGMKEDGQAIAGMLQEGATLTQEFMLMPGKCYTILGQGLPPIAQLDMQLAMKPLLPSLPPAVLAASNTQGPNASIAPGTKCYKNPVAIAASVILTVKATKGSGVAGAQVYSK